jgi:tetratricopeptide (TPR) repeat protein
LLKGALQAGLIPVAVFLMMATIRPYLADGYFQSALEASKRDEVDRAMDLAVRAVELAPYSGSYHNFLASVLRRKGDLTGEARWYPYSLDHAEKAVALEPQMALYHAERAKTLWSLGDSRSALEEFKKARALYPANPAHANDLARALIQTGRYEPALAELNTVRGMQKEYLEEGYWDIIHFFEAHFLRAEAYRGLKDHRKVVEAYRDALVLAEMSPAVFSLSRRDLDRTESTSRLAARAHYLMGETLRDMGLDNEAVAQYHLALQKDPMIEMARLRLEGLR